HELTLSRRRSFPTHVLSAALSSASSPWQRQSGRRLPASRYQPPSSSVFAGKFLPRLTLTVASAPRSDDRRRLPTSPSRLALPASLLASFFPVSRCRSPPPRDPTAAAAPSDLQATHSRFLKTGCDVQKYHSRFITAALQNRL
ncbi:unnamed protein product, partial [Urochloa humidicola]